MYYRCIIRGYYGIDGRERFRYSITACDNYCTFKSKLKTHLFTTQLTTQRLCLVLSTNLALYKFLFVLYCIVIAFRPISAAARSWSYDNRIYLSYLCSDFVLMNLHSIHNQKCGPMPNVMVALPNVGGALYSVPQSLSDAHYYMPCSNAAKTWKPLKVAGVTQTRQQISAASRPKFAIL